MITYLCIHTVDVCRDGHMLQDYILVKSKFQIIITLTEKAKVDVCGSLVFSNSVTCVFNQEHRFVEYWFA